MSARVNDQINTIILINLSSEEAKSGTLRKLRKIKTSLILVVFSEISFSNMQPKKISIFSHITAQYRV